MKFRIKAKTLLSQLVAAGKAISNKPTVKILGYFKFDVADGMLTVTASDTENVIATRVPVEDADTDGKFCMEAKRMTELLKAMPDCFVTIEIDLDENKAVMKYEKGKYGLSAIAANDYPITEEIDENAVTGRLKMPTTQILNALDKTAFATSDDPLKPIIGGVYWDIEEDAITFVATNTHILAKFRSTQTKPGFKGGFVMHSKGISLLRTLISKEAEVEVVICDKCIFIVGETFTLRTSKVNGVFPNYNRVIPDKFNNTCEIDRASLLDAVKRVSICCSPLHSLMLMKFSMLDMTVEAQDIDYNVSGSESLTCGYSGTEMKIGFNAGFLRGILEAINSQNIEIRLNTFSNPGIIVPTENEEFGELTMLIMPMQIEDAK